MSYQTWYDNSWSSFGDLPPPGDLAAFSNLCASVFRRILLQPKYAIIPLQTSTSRLHNPPYHHLQEFGLDYCKSYGGISVIPPNNKKTSRIRSTNSKLLRPRGIKEFSNYLYAQYKKNECTEFIFDGLMMSSELKNGASPNRFRG